MIKKILIDSQHGKKRLINVEKKDFEKIKTSNSTIFAQRYKVTGTQDKPNGKKIDYDHKVKAEEYKYSKEFSLKTVSMNYMPAFLQKNSNKYFEWFDFDK